MPRSAKASYPWKKKKKKKSANRNCITAQKRRSFDNVDITHTERQVVVLRGQRETTTAVARGWHTEHPCPPLKKKKNLARLLVTTTLHLMPNLKVVQLHFAGNLHSGDCGGKEMIQTDVLLG